MAAHAGPLRAACLLYAGQQGAAGVALPGARLAALQRRGQPLIGGDQGIY